MWEEIFFMKPMVIDGPRMSDIGEREESSLLREVLYKCLEQKREILGVHLWTHSPFRIIENPVLLPTLQTIHQLGIPLAIEVTITGLGGSAIEPGIESTEKAFSHLRSLLNSGLLSPDRICLRIDPLQAWQGPDGRITNTGYVDGLLDTALSLGIQRFRVSLITLGRYQAKILPRARHRHLFIAQLNPSEICTKLRGWIAKGADIRSCATDLLDEGIPSGACFDFSWVTGQPLETPYKPVAKRKHCLCHVPESVMLWKVPRRSDCSGGCLACYAQGHKT